MEDYVLPGSPSQIPAVKLPDSPPIRRPLTAYGLAFCVGLLLLAVSPAFALNWGSDVVYSGGAAGSDASLALSSGTPLVVYSADGNLYMATRGVDVWTSELVAPCGFGGGWCSTAANPAGPSGIAFIDASQSSNIVTYAYRSGSGWITEKVDDAGWLADYVSLVYDQSGTPMIAYCASPGLGEPASVRFARRTGPNAWSIETVSPVGDVTGPSMTLDSQQRPVISFADVATGALDVAIRTAPASWTVAAVDGTLATPVQWYTSVRSGIGNALAVAYFKGDSSGSSVHLKYAQNAGGTWTTSNVIQLDAGGTQYCSLAEDSSGTPSIAFLESSSLNLWFAKLTPGGWFSEVVDSGDLTGYHPSLALDPSGNPLIAYVDYYFGDVKYASTQPGDISSGKLAPDGDLIRIGNVTTTTSGSDLPDSIFVESTDRSSGIQAEFGGALPSVARGSTVQLDGVMGTLNGERCILYPELTVSGAGAQLAPVSMAGKNLGGGDFFFSQGPPVEGQQGVLSGSGLNNIGLLVRAWGRVTQIGTGYLYMDDGAGLLDGTATGGQPDRGVRVVCNPAAYAPGDFLMVTGLSSCYVTPDGAVARCVLARGADGIVNVTAP